MEQETTPDTKENESLFNIRFIIGLFCAACVFAILNLALTLLVLDRSGNLTSREIVSINAADMVMGFVASQDPSISEEELKAKVLQLNQSLDPIISAFAAENNLIVVNSAAVLGGTRDITPAMLASLGLKQ